MTAIDGGSPLYAEPEAFKAKERERQERAQRALAVAEQMRHTLTTLVRHVADDPRLKVKFTGSGAYTDGHTVWTGIPIELADLPPHDRLRCGVLAPDGRQACKTCSVREEILANIFHEASHVLFDSFERVQGSSAVEFIERALRPLDEDNEDVRKFRETIHRLKMDASGSVRASQWMLLAKSFSPWLGPILNAFEDSRVNALMAKARHGVYRLLYNTTVEIFENGIPSLDGETQLWKDQPRDAQVIVGAFCASSDYPYKEWFAEEAVEILDDAIVRDLCQKAKTTKTVSEVFQLAVQLYVRLRELGCLADKEEPSACLKLRSLDPGDSDSDDSGSGGSSSDDSESGDSDSGDSESGDPESGDSESGDSESGDSESGDSPHESSGEADQETVDRANELLEILGQHAKEPSSGADLDDQEAITLSAESFEFFDQPSGTISGLTMEDFDSPQKAPLTPGPVLYPSLKEMRITFAVNRRSGHERDLRRGRGVDAAVLGRRVPVEDGRLFTKKLIPKKRDYFVLVGLDHSGSTAGEMLTPERKYTPILPVIHKTGLAVGDLLSLAGIRFSMYGHTGSDTRLRLAPFKEPNQPWNEEARARVWGAEPQYANLDGHTLEIYRKLCQAQTATNKLILYFTDGAMPAENYKEELEILQREIRNAPKNGVTILGVGIGNDEPKDHGLDTVRINGVEDIPKLIRELKSRLQ